VKVLGFELKADAGSDVAVSSVNVSFAQSNTSASKRLNRYAGTISIWDSNGVKVGSSSVADFSESSDVYSRSIPVSGVVIRANQKADYFVTVDALSNIDSADYTNDAWTATLTSVRYSDASGAILQTNQSVARSFDFTSLASASDLELQVSLSPNNHKAATVKTSTTSSTNGIELLQFNLKAQGGQMLVDKIPVMLTTSNTSGLAVVTGNVTLNIGGSTFSESVTATATSATVIFDDLNLTLSKDSTITGIVTADVNSFGVNNTNYAQGTTLKAQVGTLSSFDVEDVNGDAVSGSDITGSAVGEVMTFRSTGVNTVMGTPSIARTTDQSGNITQVTYTIPVAVTSFGNTLYIGQSAQLATSVSGSNAFNVVYENSTTPSTETVSGTSSVTLASSNATVEGNGFRLDDGQTKNFTITVNLIDPAAAGSYRVRVDNIQTFTDANLGAGAATSALLPVESYRTDYQLINS